MPTKTVIFTSLNKFDGNSERELYCMNIFKWQEEQVDEELIQLDM